MRSFLAPAALVCGLLFSSCDSVVPSSAASADPEAVACSAPTLHSIVAYGSSAVDVAFSYGSTNADHRALQGNVEIRAVGSSAWVPAEGTVYGSVLRVWDVEIPPSGGTTYDVRARQVCYNDPPPAPPGELGMPDSATSGPSNLLRKVLLYTANGS
ncbi:hypothetical protein [Rubrivirga sp. SAORIC476]|uniref:hypothetical protein n=1 Tax=Rubrivirga sp. SAORIC476 TaxID=1961794 RepID=UPI001179D6E4|nr:hypothetical protein [Rubrivirga sp. SAORIC476]